MPRPLIGITCGTSALEKEAANLQDRLNLAYSRALWEAGAAPVLLPTLEHAEATDYLARLDGLLLSGGYDVCPSLYGEEALNETVRVDEPRDRAELPLIRAAVESGLPLLAICRGIQSLNVALGGTLYQDIPAQIKTSLQHSQRAPRPTPTHRIAIRPDSRLAQIIGDTRMEVNSFHHQALKDVAEGLEVVAWAEDGVVEAVEAPQARFLLGVQFHPEEMVGEWEEARRLFRAFVAAAQGPPLERCAATT